MIEKIPTSSGTRTQDSKISRPARNPLSYYVIVKPYTPKDIILAPFINTIRRLEDNSTIPTTPLFAQVVL